VIVNDIQIVLKEVTDSRCPTGAQCIQAGEAKAVFEITGQGKKESITLSSVGSNQVASHGYLFSIKDVKPLPNLSTEIKQPDYRVTLLIEQENKG